MEKKINIAKLLKNCPKGMELDCTMYDNVTLIKVSNNSDPYPIKIKTKCGFKTCLTEYGQNVKIESAKCVIFPKGKTTWEGFVPPCQFKDGDVVYAIDEGNEYIFIFKEIYENERVYCYLNLKGGDLRIQEVWLTDYNPTHRLASEEEKAKLFQAIKDKGYKWNAKTKTLEKLIQPKFKVGDRVVKKNCISAPVSITKVGDEFYYSDTDNYTGVLRIQDQDDWVLVRNKFDITTLKPFDKVLVRDSDKNMWCASIFSHTWKDKYICVDSWHNQCIPYEENKHLLNTTNDCDEFYKTW